MALQTEDASTVLEQFIQDVANLPAEIAHLLEEIQAKDEFMSQCRTKIHDLDSSLQKHVKLKGALVKFDREDAIVQAVNAHYDRAQALQEEKLALSNKAAFLLDRHVKRLDLKIRDLQTDGAMGVDPSLPSLLHDSHANRVTINSTPGTGASTPIHPLANASGSSTNVANAAMAQMLNRVAHQNTLNASAPAAAMQPHPMLNGGSQNSVPRRRDVSAGGASDSKRRRFNATIPLPSAAANMHRHSSLGPSTPKAGTPAASRAGSAGPRTKKLGKKVPPHVQSSMRKKHGKTGMSKSNARRLVSNKKGTPSSTGDDDSGDEDSGSDEDPGSVVAGKDGAGDDDDMDVVVQDDDADDSKLYCFCKSVSHGDMVACDNEDCPHEWFHWECVGLTSEPKGRWLCEHCRKLPQSRIKLAR